MDETRPKPGEPGYTAWRLSQRQSQEHLSTRAERIARRSRDRDTRVEILAADEDGVYAPTGQDTYLEDLRGETVREVTGIRAIPWDMLR